MGSELFGWIIMIGASYALICFFAWIGRGAPEALDESAHGDVIELPVAAQKAGGTAQRRSDRARTDGLDRTHSEGGF